MNDSDCMDDPSQRYQRVMGYLEGQLVEHSILRRIKYTPDDPQVNEIKGKGDYDAKAD